MCQGCCKLLFNFLKSELPVGVGKIRGGAPLNVGGKPGGGPGGKPWGRPGGGPGGRSLGNEPGGPSGIPGGRRKRGGAPARGHNKILNKLKIYAAVVKKMKLTVPFSSIKF